MGSRKEKIAFIPVRGGSKSIPRKNIKKICGKPLVYWVIDAALESNIFNGIYVSTDDSKIRQVVEHHPEFNKLTLVERSKETATDTATTESAMLEFAQKVEFEIIVLLQATSPLLKGDDLKQAMEQYLKDENATGLLSVCKQTRFLWEKNEDHYYKPTNYNPFKRPRRQEFDGFLAENGAFYITDKESLIKTESRISGNIICYEMPAESYYELDELSDWKIVAALLNKKKSPSFINKLKNIKLFLTDVDGVLTDAGMYYSERGDELKKFNTRDGKGLELLRKSGIEVGIITSETTKIVEARAQKLNVEIIHQGIKDKNKTLEKLLAETGHTKDEVGYIGDDINDLSIIEQVGFSACPADAMKEVKSRVDYVCKKGGGGGCVREVAEIILKKATF